MMMNPRVLPGNIFTRQRGLERNALLGGQGDWITFGPLAR
jgi:hypothetical protein